MVGDEVTRALRAIETKRNEISAAYALLIGKPPTRELLYKANELVGLVGVLREAIHNEMVYPQGI